MTDMRKENKTKLISVGVNRFAYHPLHIPLWSLNRSRGLSFASWILQTFSHPLLLPVDPGILVVLLPYETVTKSNSLNPGSHPQFACQQERAAHENRAQCN